jgi:hypothetical protein
VFEVGVFLALMCMMKKKHNLEFRLSLKTNVVYIIVQTVKNFAMIYPTIWVYQFLSMGEQMIVSKPSNVWVHNFDYACNFLEEENWMTSFHVIIIINLLLPVLEFCTIFNVLFIKRVDDGLQGISKLDYLLKVSKY